MIFDYIRLNNGKKFKYTSPKPSDFEIGMIAKSLSQQCRYVGHTKVCYSIAEHCCRVCDIMPEEYKLEGLMHDAAESVTGDVNTILKNLLPEFRAIELDAEAAMSRKHKLKFPFPAAVKTADMRLLTTEMRDLLPASDWQDEKLRRFPPLEATIKPWSPAKAEREFLKRYEKYKRT